MEEFKVELENLTDKEKKTFLHLVKKSKKKSQKTYERNILQYC